MQHVILRDKKISEGEFEQWKEDDIAFWQKNANITPSYAVLQYDYSDYPTEVDSDGDIRADAKWLQSLNDTVTSIYGQFGVDFIMVVIHEDNWKSDPAGPGGIWGTNYSYRFGKQTLQYCRWDRDNSANTFGALYHERHHSLDAIIKQELGVKIEPVLGVPVGRYDSCITHGKCEPWKYIRHKENQKSIQKIRIPLQKAFAKRRLLQRKIDQNEQNVVMRALNLLYYILRMQFNEKNGVKKG